MKGSVSRSSETGDLNKSLEYIGDVEELKEQYLINVRPFKAEWSEKIEEIMNQHSYSQQAMAKLCGVSSPGVRRWLKDGSIPGKRETFIRIGLAAGYDLAEMNKFLQRYGRYNQLYAKSLEDSVYIFVLNSETLPHTYAVCKELLERIEKRFQLPETSPINPKGTGVLNLALLSLETSDELEQFIQDNLAQYRSAFSKFYDRVWRHIRTIEWNYIDEDNEDRKDGFSIKQLADTQGWSGSLRSCVSEIRQRKWFPRRTKVISLGLHLNLNREMIDELLELAHMEPLCAKNPVEGAIIFAVMDAEVRDLIQRDVCTDLCEHVREILEKLELPDTEDIIEDLRNPMMES